MTKNHPDLWRNLLPVKTDKGHKYTYGHTVIYGAPELTGATRLTASACARMGAGLVSVLSDKNTANIYRTALPAHILVRDDLDWHDDRVSTKIYGPGGLPVQPDFHATLPVILDADALTNLPKTLTPNYILTPHEGEFERAFPTIKGTRLEKAQQAAQSINAHIILKGAQTIIAAPNRNPVINHHASPHLATAGSGDVLTGMIAGLIAQDMPIFESCCAAVWIHGECARNFGAGLVASDLIDRIPQALQIDKLSPLH